MSIKAIFFDFSNVLYQWGAVNTELVGYIRAELQPHYKLGIITNLSRLGQHGGTMAIDDLFTTAINVPEAGISKSDPAIYELACQRLGVKPAEAVFVDDVARYCLAARQAGMTAIVYTNFTALVNELQQVLPGAVQ